MKLITKKLEKKIPNLHSTEELENPNIIIHYFNPLGRGDWYVLEGEKQENNDWLFWGYVKSPLDPSFDEYGYFTLNELASINLPFGLGIERELYWTECPIKEIL